MKSPYICRICVNSVLASWIPIWYWLLNYVTLFLILFWWLTFVEGHNTYLQDITPLNKKHVSIKKQYVEACNEYLHVKDVIYSIDKLQHWSHGFLYGKTLYFLPCKYIYFINFNHDPMNSFMAGPGCLIFFKAWQRLQMAHFCGRA